METCKHDMEMHHNWLFRCRKCGQTEFCCSHGRTEIKRGIKVCLICNLQLMPEPGSLSPEETAELLGSETIDCSLTQGLELFRNRHCRHELRAVDFDDVSNGRLICGRCNRIIECDHRRGYMESLDGSCHCRLCGKYLGHMSH